MKYITKWLLLIKQELIMGEMVIRMTRCPNECAGPFAEEIGLVGTALGKYDLQLCSYNNQTYTQAGKTQDS